MRSTSKFAAFDLGASNGRLWLGTFDGRKLACEEVHQFPNVPVYAGTGIYWDVPKIFAEMKKGLALCAKKHGAGLSGIGVDTWGQDFGLLDRQGMLMGNPHHYRDRRTEGLAEEIAGLVDGYEVYETTGTRLARISTLCQLYSLVKERSPDLAAADILLMVPGLLNYFLCGEKFLEPSIITPTCLYDIRRQAPAEKLLRRLGIPEIIIGRIGPAGTVIGKLCARVGDETGLGPVPVIAPAMHDTASAVLSAPADGQRNWVFLSSGTWSMFGFETDRPAITRENYDRNIVNVATAEGKSMTLVSLTGLWLLQECRRIWEHDGDRLSYSQLAAMAAKARPFRAFIDVNDGLFVNPANMPEAIADYCRKTGQPAPEEKGSVVRSILESLTLKYKASLEALTLAAGRRFEVLHLMGGGARNELLCRFTASALGIPVLAGPFEATVLGNLLMQMKGAGEISSVGEGRALLRESVVLTGYEPDNPGAWDEAFAGYERVCCSRNELSKDNRVQHTEGA